MSLANITLAKRWFDEGWNERRDDLIYEIAAPDCGGYAPSGDWMDIDTFVDYRKAFLQTVPDLRIDIESTVAERDEVVVRWKAAGHRVDPAPSAGDAGEAVEIHGLTWFRMRDGKVVEARDCSNVSRMMAGRGVAAGG